MSSIKANNKMLRETVKELNKDREGYALRVIYNGTPEDLDKVNWFTFIGKVIKSC